LFATERTKDERPLAEALTSIGLICLLGRGAADDRVGSDVPEDRSEVFRDPENLGTVLTTATVSSPAAR